MATYRIHGDRLRQQHPTHWLLMAIVVVAALVGAGAWALVNADAGGTAGATTGSARLTSTDVANKYIAALDQLKPSALTPILAKNVVSIDWAYGSSTFHGAKTLERNWAGVFATSGDAHFRGSLRSVARDWATVTWSLSGSTNPLTYEPFKMNGLSILNIGNGKIVRETYYWDVPGRNSGIAGTVGRRFAAVLAAHHPGWGVALRSLYSKDAVEISVSASTAPDTAPSTQDVDNLIWGRWAMPSLMPLDASLRCAGPSFRLDNGKMRLSWAVVDWVAKDASPGRGNVSGVSILQLMNGKIIRETMYY